MRLVTPHIFLFAEIRETGKARRRLSGFLHCTRSCLAANFRLQRKKNIMYAAPCAAVVVEAQPSDAYLTETTTMIITGLILSVLGVALLCWLLFALSVQALPLFIGAFAGALVFQNGAGAVLAIVVGLVSAASAFGITRFAFARTGSASARLAIAVLVMAPAAIAGYHATLGVARIAVSSESGRQILALLGSIVIGCAALVRLTAATTRVANERTAANAHFTPAATPNDG